MSDVMIGTEKVKPGEDVERTVSGVKDCGRGMEMDDSVGEDCTLLSEYSFKWVKVLTKGGEAKYVRKDEFKKAKEV